MLIEGDDATRPSATQTAAAYDLIRSEIIAGGFRPGERLAAETLRQRYGVGLSPIREALNRLLAEGWVALEAQKGFRVAPVSEADLRELVKARCWIDGAAVTESIRLFDRAWEDGLVLALHHLTRVERGKSLEGAAEWERLHKAFHLALIGGCGSRWMMRTSAQLFDAAERYRLLAADQVPERNELDEHRAIVEACFDRDVERAVDLLGRHYGRTFDVIVRAFSAPA